jgi:hypothetical protein
MLAQLVCVDRRYQRMNCFNIREIQSILKRRFFNDLINTADHHTILNQTMLGLRYKTHNLNTLNPNIFLFYNYGLDLSFKNRSFYSSNDKFAIDANLIFSNSSLTFTTLNKLSYFASSTMFTDAFALLFDFFFSATGFSLSYNDFLVLLSNLISSINSFSQEVFLRLFPIFSTNFQWNNLLTTFASFYYTLVLDFNELFLHLSFFNVFKG